MRVPVVLTIEDDPDARDFVRFVLESEGYWTIAAANGAAGLDEMQRRRPDAVTLDLMMSVMDGWTFRQRQLADPALADIPVICVTAFHEPAQASTTLSAPCLQKSLDIEELFARLQQALSRE